MTSATLTFANTEFNAGPTKPEDGDYYYLAGPMSNIAQFNFPLFDRVSLNLRNDGYVIVSPAELDSDDVREMALNSPDGSAKTDTADWRDFLRRDLEIVMDNRCIGIICLPGWQHSKGALLETYVGTAFGKEILEYWETDVDYVLMEINRSQVTG